MHLCIDARMARCSGVGTYIRQVIPYLKSMKITLLVDSLDSNWAAGFDQIHLPAPIYSASEQIFLPRAIPRCDLFWSPHYNVPLLPIKAKKRVATIHDVCHLVYGSFAQKLYAKLVMRKALYGSDQVITGSHFSSKEICTYLGREVFHVVPHGVNRRHFVRQVSCSLIQEKYRLPKRFVLFVGNFKPNKNLERLMRAFKRVNISGLDLVIVGKGTARGPVLDEELPILYSMAEMFVFPSLYEGFGLPPLEAMSCGCPVIVSRAASLPEVCGDGALYFDPESEEEIASIIRKMALDSGLRQKLVEKGLKRVEQFEWKRSAEHHQQIFESCMK